MKQIMIEGKDRYCNANATEKEGRRLTQFIQSKMLFLKVKSN
jgi:hypothetical protein